MTEANLHLDPKQLHTSHRRTAAAILEARDSDGELIPQTPARVLLALLDLCQYDPANPFPTSYERLRAQVAARRQDGRGPAGLKPQAIGDAADWLEEQGFLLRERQPARAYIWTLDLPDPADLASRYAHRYVELLEEQPLRPTAHVALARLAHYADGSGSLFGHTMAELAEIAGCDRKTMRRVLEDTDWVTATERPEARDGRASEWDVDLGQPGEAASWKGYV